ncbi:uncharacterized protein TM35_000121880, partial [Trypanosoma theileri]
MHIVLPMRPNGFAKPCFPQQSLCLWWSNVTLCCARRCCFNFLNTSLVFSFLSLFPILYFEAAIQRNTFVSKVSKKIHMRRLLFAALLLLCCAYGCIAKTEYRTPYPPDPDLEVFPETEESRTWGMKVVNVVPREEVKEGQWQSIRIAVNPGMIQDEIMYCMSKGREIDGYTRRIRNGFDERVCSAVSGYAGVQRMRTLMLRVMPRAIALHVERLKVKRVKEALRINVPTSLHPISDAEGTMCVEMVPVFDGDQGM